MEILKGEKGLELTWQDSFPKETECTCGGVARVAFVAQENSEEGEYISHLHHNIPREEFWPHDAISVAVYFCKKCFKPVTLWNQA